MFESMKSRWWVLVVAQHELQVAGLQSDQQAIREVSRQFEADMKASNHWPFQSPEKLGLHFTVWLATRPDLQSQYMMTGADSRR
jgi:hypothetical protein